MSLILDALNRSERERRQDGDVPGIATEHYAAAPVQGNNRLQLLLLASLAIAVLVIGWLVLDRWTANESRPVAVSVPATSLPTPGPAAKPAEDPPAAEATQPAQQPKPPVPVAQANDAAVIETAAIPEDVANLYQRSSVERSPASPSASLAAQQTRAADTAADTQPVPTATEVVEETVDLEAQVALAEEEVGNARLLEHPAPFLASLSQQKKDEIPTLMYSRHDYSSDSRQSSVVINGKSLRSGGSVGGGISVKEILPDSVVLSHQGTDFRLRALNSWVNL